MTRRRKNKRNAERARRKEFYERALRDGLGSTAQSDGAASEAANEAARTGEADRLELERVAREVLYTQPQDTELVLKSSRLLGDVKGKASERKRKKDLAQNLQDTLDSLEEQLLPHQLSGERKIQDDVL